jgi:hypothetical protein
MTTLPSCVRSPSSARILQIYHLTGDTYYHTTVFVQGIMYLLVLLNAM